MLLYRLALTLLAAKELGARLVRGDGVALKERMGYLAPDATPRIWIHAASNGEVVSARPVVDRLLAEGRALLVTVNTDSAAAAVRSWDMPGLRVHLAPLDLRSATRRVYTRLNIVALVTLETDLWPERILTCPGPVLVLGGRLTERSAKGWARFDRLAHKVLGRIDYLSAQDRGSMERFHRLGLRPEAVGPVFDLKALYTPPDAQPDAALRAAFPRHDTWLAASTHDTEDIILLAAHKAALRQRPGLRLILAPRHPKRGDAIAALIREAGLSVARRSAGDDPAGAQVYLVDTMGEMHLWYALAGITFVAGSLSDRGGHTPYEPAAFRSAILHGPDTANFTAAYDRLHQADAARMVRDSGELAEALIALEPEDVQATLGRAAEAALRQGTSIDNLIRDFRNTLDA